VVSLSVTPVALSGTQATVTGPVIRYAPGSTIKLEQLLGKKANVYPHRLKRRLNSTRSSFLIFPVRVEN